MGIGREETRILVIAGGMHDYDHTCKRNDDQVNIDRAIAGLRKHILPEDEKYFEAIMAGAKFRLMRMPKKEWTSFDLASVYFEDFERRVSEAQREALRDFVRDNQTIGRVTAWP